MHMLLAALQCCIFVTSATCSTLEHLLCYRNGLEVPRQLQWTKWHAGGEFVKVLCVKNVATDVSAAYVQVPFIRKLD